MEADGSGVVGDQRSADHGPEARFAGGHEQGADGARLDEREQWAQNLWHPELVEMFPAVRVGHLGDDQVGCLERRKSLSRAPRCVHKEKAVRYPQWPGRSFHQGKDGNVSTSEVAYRCDKASFTPGPHGKVRWLDPEVDDQAFVQFCISGGETAARGDLQTRAGAGFTYAGVFEEGLLVARAALWTYSPDAWELAAVSTLRHQRRNGLGRSVCSFVTEAILAAGRIATCHTDATNTPMRLLAESLGFAIVV